MYGNGCHLDTAGHDNVYILAWIANLVDPVPRGKVLHLYPCDGANVHKGFGEGGQPEANGAQVAKNLADVFFTSAEQTYRQKVMFMLHP